MLFRLKAAVEGPSPPPHPHSSLFTRRKNVGAKNSVDASRLAAFELGQGRQPRTRLMSGEFGKVLRIP